MFKALIFIAILTSCTPAAATDVCDSLKSLAITVQTFKSTGHPQYEYEALVRKHANTMEPGAESRGMVRSMRAIGDLVYSGYSADEIYAACMK